MGWSLYVSNGCPTLVPVFLICLTSCQQDGDSWNDSSMHFKNNSFEIIHTRYHLPIWGVQFIRFYMLTVLYIHQKKIFLEHFHHIPIGSQSPFLSSFSTPTSQLWETTNLLFVSIDLFILVFLYKWNHTSGSLLWLTSFI